MEEKYTEFLKQGKINEDIAARAIEEAYGGIVTPATEEVDMKCHTDLLWLTPKGVLCSIDKKKRKKIGRRDEAFNDNYTWIELLDNAGNAGSSVCQGQKLRDMGFDVEDKNDYLMLETSDEYLFVRRSELNPFVWSLVEGKETVHENPRVPNVPYQRKGRRDLIVLVRMDDIRKITRFKIKKTHAD